MLVQVEVGASCGFCMNVHRVASKPATPRMRFVDTEKIFEYNVPVGLLFGGVSRGGKASGVDKKTVSNQQAFDPLDIVAENDLGRGSLRVERGNLWLCRGYET